MKNLAQKILFGKDSGITLVLCGLLLFALACKCGTPDFDKDDSKPKSTPASDNSTRLSDNSSRSSDNSSTSGNTSVTPREDSSRTTSPFPSDDKSSDKSSDKPLDLGDKTSSAGSVSDSEAQDLARETMMDLSDAIRAGDFKEFLERQAKSPEKISVEKFASGFAGFIDKKDQVNPILDKIPELDATFTNVPKISKEAGSDVLNLEGNYPTSTKTNFKLKYVKDGGIWKLLKIEVEM